MVNTLFFYLIIVRTLKCQALNNLCLCLSYSIFVLQSQLTEFSGRLRQQQNNNTSSLVSRPKKRHGTRAITNRGQLFCNCPLSVLQSQGNFMQSVIRNQTSYSEKSGFYFVGSYCIQDSSCSAYRRSYGINPYKCCRPLVDK